MILVGGRAPGVGVSGVAVAPLSRAMRHARLVAPLFLVGWAAEYVDCTVCVILVMLRTRIFALVVDPVSWAAEYDECGKGKSAFREATTHNAMHSRGRF